MSLHRFHGLLLACLLVFMQQGQLHHEYSEHTGTASSPKKQPEGGRCDTCLAYAQVAGLAASSPATSALLTFLTFHHRHEAIATIAPVDALLARSRGPPLLLAIS